MLNQVRPWGSGVVREGELGGIGIKAMPL